MREHLGEVESSSGIRILHKSRDGRKRVAGGGVAIAFDTATCNLKQRHLKHMRKDSEVMCAVGRIGKVGRPIAIFAIYLPPSMRAPELAILREQLAVEVASLRSTYKNPAIFIGGDTNHRDIGDAVGEVGDFTVLDTGPTRGSSTIDVAITNVPSLHSETLTLPPLMSETGRPSDHMCIYTEAVFPKHRGYEWAIRMRRTRDQAREAAFAEELEVVDWGSNFAGVDADGMALALERVIKDLTDKHFPLVRVRKRSNEAPWITKTIRRLWKRKIRLYKKAGRCQAWWDTDRILQTKIDEAKNGFVDRILEEGGAGKTFYAATKKLASPNRAPDWNVRDLFSGLGAEETCKEILGFYGAIAGECMEPIPEVRRVDGGLGHFSVQRVAELLQQSKKTDSRVDGDPLAHLIRKHPYSFAAPVAEIFNKVNTEGVWPSTWKTEHLTIIPKIPNPSSLAECRNISCTSAFSKVLEGVVLLQLRSELVSDPSQYGGTPKCGAEHMLVDIWEKVLTALEGGKSAAVLLGVDYEKAFNRMEHAVCLDKLRSLGASDGSISLVRAFLHGRCMTVTVDGHKAEPVPLLRGSPQGSVLGCLLYCITTQLLTTNLRGADANRGPSAFLYVDDTTLVDVADLESASRHCTVRQTVQAIEDLELGEDFDELSRRADEIGMRINDKKTQLLVISPPNGCDTTAEFSTREGHLIKSVESLRLVGFTFGKTPSASGHVDALVERYKQKKWMLYHLRDAGFKGGNLFRLYACYVRSIFEYCSPVYHSLLTRGQEEQLERLQRHAIRVCHGYEVPVEEHMETWGISTLKDRRSRRMDKFIRKAAANPRFSSWFPPRDGVARELRNRRGIQEPQAFTCRRFNSPLSFIKRRANELGIVPAAG